MNDLTKVGALWKKDGKNGTFYSGQIDAEKMKSALAGGETRLLLFKVKNKRERGPDLELFAAPDTRQERPSGSSARPSRVDDVSDFDDSVGF